MFLNNPTKRQTNQPTSKHSKTEVLGKGNHHLIRRAKWCQLITSMYTCLTSQSSNM